MEEKINKFKVLIKEEKDIARLEMQKDYKDDEVLKHRKIVRWETLNHILGILEDTIEGD